MPTSMPSYNSGNAVQQAIGVVQLDVNGNPVDSAGNPTYTIIEGPSGNQATVDAGGGLNVTAQGPVANGGTSTAKPILTGGVYSVSGNVLNNGQIGSLQLDSTSRLITAGVVSGDRSEGSTDLNGPIKIGGRAYAGVPNSVSDLQRTNAWFDLQGAMVIRAAYMAPVSLTLVSGTPQVFNLTQWGGVAIQIAGLSADTLLIEHSIDGVTYVAATLLKHDLSVVTSASNGGFSVMGFLGYMRITRTGSSDTLSISYKGQN